MLRYSYRLVMCVIIVFLLSYHHIMCGVPDVSAKSVTKIDRLDEADDPWPPDNAVKLIFIHHSCGQNWLADSNGGLGEALRDNNYFVSDVNYGWGPNGIGDNTDLGHWWSWFCGPSRETYMNALYTEYDQHSSYSRLASDPGGQNEIIMFKSCYPNSNLRGNPGDPPTTGSNPLRDQDCYSEEHSVANAKGVYNDLLDYFVSRQDKLFIVITAPPVQNGTWADNARAFNTWLVRDWLDDAGYTQNNVAVFDFYNVLTSNGGNWYTNDLGWDTGNHHRYRSGAVQYITTQGGNTAAYPDGGSDNHPSQAGNQKATDEFVPLLNMFFHRWRSEVDRCTLAVTRPAGDEIWCVGESEEITWTSGNTGGTVTIDYSSDGGNTWQVMIESTPDDGRYVWIIPGSVSLNCLIGIHDTSAATCGDTSGTSFQICLCEDLKLQTESLSPGTEGCQYSHWIEAVGGCLPYEWTIQSGQLPDDLHLNISSGILAGIPEETGPFEFTVEVTDGLGENFQKSFSLHINEFVNSKGDVDANCEINIVDVVAVINIILETTQPTPDQQWCADCNGPPGNCDGDGYINILDALKIVGLILGSDSCP